MSVKELEIKADGRTSIIIKHGTNTGKFGLQVTDGEYSAAVTFDRSQAHLLMLYLQEHLK